MVKNVKAGKAGREIHKNDESKFFRPQPSDFPHFAQEKIWKNLQSQTVGP
jgi:hypothetical protein